jgi:hypothetical protein
VRTSAKLPERLQARCVEPLPTLATAQSAADADLRRVERPPDFPGNSSHESATMVCGSASRYRRACRCMRRQARRAAGRRRNHSGAPGLYSAHVRRSAQVSRPRRSSDRRSPSEGKHLPSNKVHSSRAPRTAPCFSVRIFGNRSKERAHMLGHAWKSRDAFPNAKRLGIAFHPPNQRGHSMRLELEFRGIAPHTRGPARRVRSAGDANSLAKGMVRDSLARPRFRAGSWSSVCART